MRHMIASIIFLAVLLLHGTSSGQVRNQNVTNLRKTSVDSILARKALIGGTTFSQSDSELTVLHGTHIRGGLKVDGIISGVVSAANPFVWSVTGSSTVSDSLRFIPGAGIVQSRSANTVTTALDSNVALKSAGLTVKGKAAAAAISMTASDINTNTSSAAQASDTSAFNFSFTGTGKPVLGVVGNTGSNIFVLDSLGRLGVGVVPTTPIHTQWIGASSAWTNDVYGNSNQFPVFVGRQSDGTVNVPKAPIAGTTMARYSGAAYNGSSFTGSKGIVDIATSENWSETGNGTVLKFWTTKSGTTSVTERIRIDDSGNLGINTTAPLYKIDIRSSTSESKVHISGTNADDGGYVGSTGGNNMFLSGGASFDGSGWIAKSANMSAMNISNGNISFYSNTSLTPGSSFVPTERMRIDASTGNINVMLGKYSQYASQSVEGMGVNCILDTVERTNLGASLGSANFNNSSVAGYYQILYYLTCATSDLSGATVSLRINWTDGVGKSKTSAALALNANTNEVDGTFNIRSAGAISYSTTVTGAISTAKYVLSTALVRLY